MKKAVVAALSAFLLIFTAVLGVAARDIPVVRGDAHGDNITNISDVTAIQRHIANLELLEGKNLAAADVNKDGGVTIDDATELQRFLAEYGNPCGVGTVFYYDPYELPPVFN